MSFLTHTIIIKDQSGAGLQCGNYSVNDFCIHTNTHTHTHKSLHAQGLYLKFLLICSSLRYCLGELYTMCLWADEFKSILMVRRGTELFR